MSPDQAFSVLRAFLADARHHFVSDDLSCEDRVVRTDVMMSANQITDHYVVALARHHRLALATFDEALAGAFAKESNLVQLVR
jgi:predicted nucleic acid-binding protein